MKKTVLITGSSKGLGRALANAFARGGYNILLHGRNEDDLKMAQQEIEAHGVHGDIVVGDINGKEARENIAEAARTHKIGTLVNNAGMGEEEALDTTTDKAIEKILQTNLVSLIMLTRRIYKEMVRVGTGTIITINSISGLEAQRLRTIYCASKWGLKGFTDALRIEAEEHGVRVMGIYPDRMKTRPEFTYGMEPEDVAEKIYREYETGDTDDLILGNRPPEFRLQS